MVSRWVSYCKQNHSLEGKLLCYTIGIKGRKYGLVIPAERLKRRGGEDGFLTLDLGHLEGRNVPSYALVHDYLVGDGPVFFASLDKWDTEDGPVPMLGLAPKNADGSVRTDAFGNQLLVLLASGTHRDGSTCEVSLSPDIKALALGYVVHHFDDREIPQGTDGEEDCPRLHFHLLKVPSGARITLQGEAMRKEEQMVDGVVQEIFSLQPRTLVYLAERGGMASVVDYWGTVSLDQLAEEVEGAEARRLYGADDDPPSHLEAHPLERTGFFHVDDLVGAVEGASEEE